MGKRLLMFVCMFLLGSVEESRAMCSSNTPDTSSINAANTLIALGNGNNSQLNNQNRRDNVTLSPMQLQKKLRSKFLASIKKSLLLSKETVKLKKEISNLRRSRDISENNKKDIRSKKISRYNRINNLLILLEKDRDELFKLDMCEMSENKAIADFSSEIQAREKKLEEIRAESQKINQEKHDNFILSQIYKDTEKLFNIQHNSWGI